MNLISSTIIKSKEFGTIVCLNNNSISFKPIEITIEVFEARDTTCFSNIKLCDIRIGEKSQLFYDDGEINVNHRINTYLMKKIIVYWDYITENEPLKLKFFNDQDISVEVNVLIRLIN